ncbi:MAG: NUDIX domain-containing protein [Candidatus Pacebacteria bacterium]|jgi:8-oxo-dGTP diphosphatase|nr:NUDIX domain-containing protein [Candidatus Paceibacterota bacterium]
MEPSEKTKVGVGVMILKDGKVLMTKRKGSHGAGDYGFPGGHLEYMESFEDCAIRETKEECGIEIKNIKFLYVTNVKKYAPKHYVHIGLVAEWASGEPVTLEPDKAEEWEWFELDNLPDAPTFEFCKLAFDAYKNNRAYYASEEDLEN